MGKVARLYLLIKVSVHKCLTIHSLLSYPHIFPRLNFVKHYASVWFFNIEFISCFCARLRSGKKMIYCLISLFNISLGAEVVK